MAPLVHTPLEGLLLFQTLHPFTVEPPSFRKISESLKNNDLIRKSDSFELERLEPDSLKELYLSLLKEEARTEASGRDEVGHKDAQQNPRKRKLASPRLDTVDEALQYNHLLPQLLNRLYFKYRDCAIKAIEDEEKKYRSLQKEVQELERGEWDARLQNQEVNSRRDSRGVSSIQTLLRNDDEEDKPPSGALSHSASSHGTQNGFGVQARTSVLPSDPKNPIPNGISQTLQAGHAVQTASGNKNDVPFLPPPQHFSHSSPTSDMNRRLPPPNQSQPITAPSPSPRLNQMSLPPPERSSASPIILPLPPGMLRSSGSPTGPLDTRADMTGQQYRTNPAMPSPRLGQHPSQQHPNQLPPPRGYSYPYYDNHSYYPVPQSPYGQGPLPPYHQPYGSMPPSQAATASPGHGSPYGNAQHYQSPMPSYPQQSGYHQSPAYYQQPPAQTPYARNKVSRFAEQHTPMVNAFGGHRSAKPAPIHTTGSSTKWKNLDTPGSVRPLVLPTRPLSREISPISDRAPSPSAEPPPTRTNGTRSRKAQQAPTDSASEGPRAKPVRGTKSRKGRGGRAGSVASSAVAESTRARTRSESVVSHTDELSMDNQPISLRMIKPEPFVTSTPDDQTSVTSFTAEEASRKPNRNRHGTLRGLETSGEGNCPGPKRKRDHGATLPSSSPALTTSAKLGFVLATRNFPRTSSTLINDIVAHKVANLFAKPLTDREAPGYKDLIYRPQDLKSIRTAIANGSKALNAAIETTPPEGNPSSIWIPETPDVVPPKGIVNSAQLEKELMRMLANAVMFNPDLPTKRGVGPAFRTRARTLERGITYDDGIEEGEEVTKGKEDVSVVKDTREMFEAVERKVGEWRSAERAAEEVGAQGAMARLRGVGEGADDEEPDELAGEEVVGSVEVDIDVGEPRVKRRRR